MKRAAILALALVLFPRIAAAQPTIVLLGGKVFTGDPSKPFAEAVAIKGNQIVAVGTDAEIQALGGNAETQRFRLGGAVVIPGINDAHTHPGRGPAGLGIGTNADSTAADLAAALAAVLDESPPEPWLIGEIGRAIMLDESVTRTKLDQLAPGRKVLLHSFTGHGTILSSRALQELGIDDSVTDPPGGRFGRNSDGKLNGRVFEYAEYPIIRKIAELTQTPGELETALGDFANQAIRFGITSIQAMPIEDDDTFEKAWRKIDSPVRMRHIAFPSSVPALVPRPPAAPRGTNGLKWILDGTPIEKGAAVRAEYEGGGKGVMNFNTLTRLIKQGLDTNQQLLFHAAGDQTTATLLAALQATPNVDWPSKRPRIEHGDGLLPDLDETAKALGVTVVLNPSHFFARSLYPTGRFMRARSLLDVVHVAIGSDGPLNPYLNIMFATERPDLPREALTRAQAVAAYTAGSAYAQNRDDLGIIAPGKLADLAVLSQDIFEVPASALPDTVAWMTIINGKIVLNELP